MPRYIAAGLNQLDVALSPVPPPVGELAGYIYHTAGGVNYAINNAHIALTQDGVIVKDGWSDIDGVYDITDITPGTYVIVVSAAGYITNPDA